MKFNEFEFSPQVKRAVSDAGYIDATEIQERTIPLLIDGKDVIGFSRTGSGKTAAFGLPAIDSIDCTVNQKMPQVLIICPTRELAMQNAQELRKFAKYKEGVKVVTIYGGQNIQAQLQQLRKGCRIIVGTPGRILDHLRRKTIKLTALRTVILDEADEMLNMGFRDDIEEILRQTPSDRQTVLFSATMPKPILDITKTYQQNAVMVEVKSDQKTVPTVKQNYYDIARGRKPDALVLLLKTLAPDVSIVFCNTKKNVEYITTHLSNNGINAVSIHGDLNQKQRTAVMNDFKHGVYSVLVASDVAARGIDVDNVDIVFNYDVPRDNEYYVHRIGRTGRAGKNGLAVTLITGEHQKQMLSSIVKYTNCKILKQALPLDYADIKIVPAPKQNAPANDDESIGLNVRQKNSKNSGRYRGNNGQNPKTGKNIKKKKYNKSGNSKKSTKKARSGGVSKYPEAPGFKYKSKQSNRKHAV